MFYLIKGRLSCNLVIWKDDEKRSDWIEFVQIAYTRDHTMFYCDFVKRDFLRTNNIIRQSENIADLLEVAVMESL